MKLTATQKLNLADAYSQEMLNANNYGSNFAQNHELVKPSGFAELYKELNLEYLDACDIAWQFHCDRDQILLEAIEEEGYTADWITPDTIAYLQKQASRQPQL